MDATTLIPYIIDEQQSFLSDKRNELVGMGLDFRKGEKDVKYLGLSPFDYSVSYYIGIDWLEEDKSYICVNPKIPNLDYIKMFTHCLNHPETSEHFQSAYHIDFTRKPIKVETDDSELTPFIIIHFLSVVDRIIRKGLKCNYRTIDDNLNSKIKGKIVWQKHIKKNVIPQREDRIYCRYQDYNVDCVENAILKKTLLFIQQYTVKYKDKYPQLIQKQNSLLGAFIDVSGDFPISKLKHIKLNKLYKDYTEAIELAKLILKRFGYSFKQIKKTTESVLPPFWIDMSKLFELYVYSKLKDEYKNEILFQTKGKYGYTDFLKLDEKLIIDTKYKKTYKDGYKIEDIRQLSGYARDVGIINSLNIHSDSIVVDCVVIYPSKECPDDFQGRQLRENRIDQFTKFYKCGIRLPVKQKNDEI